MRLIAPAVAALLLAAPAAEAQLLTFDDVPATIDGYHAPIPPGYGGFAWAGSGDIGIINGTATPFTPGGT